jgi:hypothetical protein
VVSKEETKSGDGIGEGWRSIVVVGGVDRNSWHWNLAEEEIIDAEELIEIPINIIINAELKIINFWQFFLINILIFEKC